MKIRLWQKICFVLGIFLFFLGIYLFVKPVLCIPKKEGIDKQSLYCLINRTRFKKLLLPLSPNKKLEKAAGLRADDIIIHNQFSHKSKSGQNMKNTAKQAGYDQKAIGENLAKGFNTNGEVFNAWMESASHSANILNSKFEDIGIAIEKDQSREIIVTVSLFGKNK